MGYGPDSNIGGYRAANNEGGPPTYFRDHRHWEREPTRGMSDNDLAVAQDKTRQRTEAARIAVFERFTEGIAEARRIIQPVRTCPAAR